jgi:Flp pilus assembly protein TadG
VRTPHARERGSTTAEFGIVSILTLTLMFGIVDFGRALYTYHLVSNVAREATRYAIVRGSTCFGTNCTASSSDIQDYVRRISPAVDTTQLNVTTTWSANPANGCTVSPYQGPGCLVTVQVAYVFSPLSALVPSVAMPMASTSQMYISQ